MPAPFEIERLRDATRCHRAERRVVRFQDVDAARTMFFARYFDWASEVYVAHLIAGGVDVPGILARSETAAPLRHVEATYVAPLFFGDRVRIELVAVDVKNTSFSLGFRVRDDDGPALRAYLQTVHVCIDPARFATVPVPDGFRAALLGDSDGLSAPRAP